GSGITASHSYSSPNTYTVTLTVDDGQDQNSDTLTVVATDIDNSPVFSPGDVVINEIMWDGGEYIELKNTTSSNITLTDWILLDDDGIIYTFTSSDTISANGYFLIEDEENCTTIQEDVVASITLSNSDGELLVLKDGTGQIIDSANQVTGGWFAGANTESGDSMERTLLPGDGTEASNWYTSVGNIGGRTGTPGEKNSPGEQPEEGEEEEQEQQQEDEESSLSYQPGDIVINEFVSDPADDDTEWIELYNTTQNEIDLTDWTIEDNTGTTYGRGSLSKLDGLIIESQRHLLLSRGEDFSFRLNNGGDIIILKYKETIIDEVAYGDFEKIVGSIEGNAPKPSKGRSLARLEDGLDTDNDSDDFAETITPTPEEPNKITFVSIPSGGSSFVSSPVLTSQSYSSDIIINEFLPDPFGSDKENEFIELKNIGTKIVDLEGWKLGDNSSRIYTISTKDFKSTKISSGGFFVLRREKTKIALNNTGGDAVKLYRPDNNLLEEIKYTGKVPEGQSYSRDESNSWLWTTTVTPGEKNIFTQPNKPPKAVIEVNQNAKVEEVIIFDGSDSFDPEGENLKFLWDFGDGSNSNKMNPIHIYKNKGHYSVQLTVTDNDEGSDTAKILVIVSAIESDSPEREEDSNLKLDFSNIIISEFIPNPKGPDTEEWIEIFNSG
ncbi:MAG: hypothetical protein COY82_01225, partial [Parcubacteria group bacterium CG_4_10_14_0_8_um_filter_35_7]